MRNPIEICVATWESPIGRIVLAGQGEVLTGLWFEGQKHFAAGLPADASASALPVFDCATAWLEAYFSGGKLPKTPLLAPSGTSFCLRVWRRLLEIPFGGTRTYGEIARDIETEIGSRTSARTVGSAVGRNPISILIPCHRVLGADGSLTGYAGGIDRKRFLLDLEAQNR